MGLRIGIVGLPNVGKSTLFNLLTSAGVLAENYPFCTIEPNRGTVEVPDERLSFLSQFLGSKKVFPGIIDFVDIAGLVKGASKGEGLGNRFLAHVRETDALMEVVRCFLDEFVEHKGETIDPIEDAAVIETELLLADLETLRRIREKTERRAKGKEKGAKERLHLVERMIDWVDRGVPLRYFEMKKNEMDLLEGVYLLTQKPLIYIANICEETLMGEEDPLLTSFKEYGREKGIDIIPLSLKIEEELSHLEKEERMLFLEEMGVEMSGVEKIIEGGFHLLDLITFFTGVGNEELRAWNVERGTSALKAAGKIHSDIEEGFIKAEVIPIDRLKGLSSLGEARQQGLLRIEGKDYLISEGDLCYFHFRG